MVLDIWVVTVVDIWVVTVVAKYVSYDGAGYFASWLAYFNQMFKLLKM